MTLQSRSDSVDYGDDPGEASSSSKEVISFPLGTQSQVAISQEHQQLVNITNNSSIVDNVTLNNATATFGHNFGVTVHGNAILHVNGATGLEQHLPIQNGLSHNDGQVVNPEGSSSSPKVPKTLKHFLKDRPTQFWLAGLCLAIMGISLVLFLSLYDYGLSPSPPLPGPEAPPIFGHDDNLGDGIQIIHRKEWLARDPLNITRVRGPLKMVRILHTASDNCSDYQTCANKILGLQGAQVVTQNLPDIAYNFMIGGDGNVYIGRGADVANDERPDALDIAFVGNFLAPYDTMSDKMDMAGRRMIRSLLEKGKLTENYIVVAQNQTEKTTSPGENVFKKLVFWPHYDSGSYFQD